MSKQKRSGVLHFADFKSPCRGNFINSLEALRSRLEADGKQVIYLFPAATAARDWARELGKLVPVYYLTGNRFKDVFLVRKLIKKHSIGIIHSHFYKLPYLLTFDIASAFFGVKQVVHLHCALYVHHGVSGVVEKIILHGKTFVGCSELLTRNVKKQYPKNRAFTAENAIYFPRLEQYEPTSRQALGLSENAVTLMIFGFLYQIKGVDLALEAVSSLNESGGDYQLILILTSNVDEIKQKICNRFGIIPSWLHLLPPRNDIAAYFSLCDAFLAPSRSEGLPYSVIEASYLGLPVVLSDIPAHASLELPCGFYFESGSADGLREKIVAALQTAPTMKEEFIRQSKMLRGKYDLSVWTDKIARIYNEL